MNKYFGVAACITIAAGLFGCSSSTTSGGSGTPDSGPVYKPIDAGGVTGDDDAGPGEDAGAPGVGNACTTNADCPGAQCSSDSYQAGPLFPTAICIATCVPATVTGEIAECGNTTDPGLCEPGATAGAGICFPLCTVTAAGTITGCLTHDVCQVGGTSQDATGATELIGVCQPGCTSTSECPTGSSCDTYQGACVTTVVAPTQDIGTSCNPEATTQACLCIGPTGSTSGFCSSACTTGSACPTGGAVGDAGADAGDAGAAGGGTLVCSAQLGGINSSDAGISFATQPTGLDGYCFPGCNQATVTTDCAALGTGATCTPDPAGGTQFTGICTLP